MDEFQDMRKLSIAYWGKRILLGVKTLVEKNIEPYGLVFPEALIIMILHRKGPSSLVELAKIIEHAHPSVLRVIDSLEDKNLIVRTPHPEDRRVKLVSLTEDAKKLAVKVHDEFISANMKAKAGVTDEEFKATIKTLEKICKNLNSHDPLDEIEKLGKKSDKNVQL